MDPEKPKNDISKDEETIKQPDSTENAPPIESRIGLGIVNAADRINKLLNNAAERREQSTETLKEVGSTVIAYLRKGVENGALYVLGASVVAGEAVEDTKDKVVSTVKGGVEATKSYFGEKVGSIRKAIQERRENALERKNLRASKREQRANEKKLDALKRETSAIEQEQKNNKIYAEIALRKSEAKDRKLARRTKHIEEFQDKLKIGKERLKSIGRSALEIINRAKATGQAAYSAWESYTPPTV